MAVKKLGGNELVAVKVRAEQHILRMRQCLDVNNLAGVWAQAWQLSTWLDGVLKPSQKPPSKTHPPVEQTPTIPKKPSRRS